MSVFSVIDLSQLPPPTVVDPLDFETILAEMIIDLQTRYPAFDALVESDPAYKVLEVAAYRELLLRARINDAARGVMLPYATGNDLDNLGSYWNVLRLVITPADPDTIPPTPAVLESDTALRRRIQLSMEGQTNAGTEGAYIFHTLSCDGRVKDARPKRLGDASILNTVLSREGDGTLSDELLENVTSHLMRPDIRQLTDELIIQSATIVRYQVRADIHVRSLPGDQQVMDVARQEVQRVVAEHHRIGGIVPVSAIYGALQQPGVSRVVLHEPETDLMTTDEQAAFCTAIELSQVSR